MPPTKRDAALLVALVVEQCADQLVDAAGPAFGAALLSPELECELMRLQRELTHVHVLASRDAYANDSTRCALVRRNSR